MFPIVILTAASLMLMLALVAFWQSVRALFGRGVDEISAAIGGDRAALIDEKNALLRALKDIEFERAVGKVSEADWKRLDTSYRTRAKVVLEALDKDLGPWREKAEKLVAERVKGAQSDVSAAEGYVRAGAAKPRKRGAAKATETLVDTAPMADIDRETSAAQLALATDSAADSATESAAVSASASGADSATDSAADSATESAAVSASASGADSATDSAADSATDSASASGADSAADSATDSATDLASGARSAAATRVCPKCAATNDLDAVFCKKCATRLVAEDAS